ncbi:hypothetical protein CEXT_625481 [Caerostris extrusa]|uniref:Uncharacterized protein n=1 Tax=Caerostris extrusa TaxID=172846 RepID=A0AAV4SBK7_CAEEX|nr:hypothetical protein CEXT_625481 [Caerostris extrusa]
MNIHVSSLSFSKQSPKHSLPVIICHAMALQQRGMILPKLRLINRQPSSNEFKVWFWSSSLEKWHWFLAMGFVKREAATQCDCFVDMFDLPPTPSRFEMSPVNGMFFN